MPHIRRSALDHPPSPLSLLLQPPQCMTNQPQSQRALLSLEQHSTRKLAQTGSLWKPGYTICFMVTARSQFNDNAETSICFKRPAQ